MAKIAYFAITIACLLPTVAGCDSGPPLIEVSGTVLVDGKPLSKGLVRLVGANNRPAKGVIDSNGRFTVGTYEADDGVVPGELIVVVNALEPLPGGQRWLVPKKYASAATSDYTITLDRPTDDLEINLSWEGKEPFVEGFSGGQGVE